MAGIGAYKTAALGVEDGAEASHEHVGRDASKQRLVDLREYLSGRRGVQGPSGKLQHAAGGGHHKTTEAVNSDIGRYVDLA